VSKTRQLSYPKSADARCKELAVGCHLVTRTLSAQNNLGTCIYVLTLLENTKRYPKLKARYNQKYDCQRAKCEDPSVIWAW
jgi:hypothetical protein